MDLCTCKHILCLRYASAIVKPLTAMQASNTSLIELQCQSVGQVPTKWPPEMHLCSLFKCVFFVCSVVCWTSAGPTKTNW